MAARAAYLGTHHPVRAVLYKLDSVRRDCLGEARPAGARVVLRAALEERIAAGDAVVEAVFVGVHVLAGERALGRRLAQDGVLLRREPLPPLLVVRSSSSLAVPSLSPTGQLTPVPPRPQYPLGTL